MISIPAEYVRIIVKPSVQRFLQEPKAFDLGFAACIFLDHFCDVYGLHTFGSSSNPKESAAAAIRKINPLIEVIHAVSVAAKHVNVQYPKKSIYVGFMVDHAEIGRSAAHSDGSYFSDGSSYYDMPDVLRIKTPDDRLHDLTFLVSSVLNTIEVNFI